MSSNRVPDHKRGQPYTPTVSAGTNVDALPTVNKAIWTANGRMVTVHMSVSADPTTAAPISFKVSLPTVVQFDFTDSTDIIGHGVSNNAWLGIHVIADQTNDLAFVTALSDDTVADTYYFSFSYLT